MSGDRARPVIEPVEIPPGARAVPVLGNLAFHGVSQPEYIARTSLNPWPDDWKVQPEHLQSMA
jgi:hypothetical protein